MSKRTSTSYKQPHSNFSNKYPRIHIQNNMEWKADFDKEQKEAPTSETATRRPEETINSSAQRQALGEEKSDRKRASISEDAEDPSNRNNVNSQNSSSNNDTANNTPTTPEDEDDELSKYMFCFASFHAVFAPVCICMILSALVVVYINTDATRAAGEAALSQSYEVFELQEGNSNQNFLASIGNTLIIIAVICAMTFVVVLLYKFRCMKFFYGYMILVTTMLLGYFTTNIILIAIQKYDIPVDWPSLIFIMYNFAIVGTLSIFYGKGIPTFVTQGYLICTSVVLAWQLSFFGNWTAWTLLVALALYDLFAVLTPCGPLRKLAELMSEADAPAIPGLLYEAALPNNVQRPSRNQTSNAKASRASQPEEQPPQQDGTVTANNSSSSDDDNDERKMPATEANRSSNVGTRSLADDSNTMLPPQPAARASKRSSEERPSRSIHHHEEVRYGKVPVSLAMVYKLQIIDEEGVLRPKEHKSLFARASKKGGDYQNTDDQEIPESYSGLELRERKDLTPRQLKAVVKVVYPHRGGWIDPSPTTEDDGGRRWWNVYNRNGELMREFVIDDASGKVFQKGETRRTSTAIEDNTIKLGLGDFIFYSVLVSKAAMNGFTSFAMCMLVILVGLCITLLLLSVYGKALPALPISIFLGVAFFFLSTAIVDPWLDSLIRIPLYV
ncbi:unnamed protein product [Cylindrotheca closterium]|uniref:Presenilin n=1 Tax=Cylindrotheca closterium TaxID=2856 RepID=A0AAD2JK55_9STRA|nr:unnamed protein product [Cylindrotheca closterium]